MPLIFVGPPASGKTVIGQAVAKRFGIPFFDLDQMIEQNYCLSIERLFQEKKESYFRLLESQCLEAFVKRSKPTSYILSTGGGAVISEKNRLLLKRCGRWIYLKASWETLARRKHLHSMLRGRSDEGVKFLLSQRVDYYSEAEWVVQVDQKPEGKIVQEIMDSFSIQF